MEQKKSVILVVDDAPTNIKILHRLLAPEHEVLCATNGAEALEIAARVRPDLILLDILMPEMDGYEVIRRLRADPGTTQIPVIFVTAMGEEADEEVGLTLGAVDYIAKPYRPLVVQARVRTHLELKRHRDLLAELACIDGLTGLYNRRHLDDTGAIEVQRAIRSGEPLSLILIDVDHFKAYNDHYGHLAGDECLRQIATALRDTLKRSTDLAFRYGGEEMACLLPNTGEEGALGIAREARADIAALALPHAGTPVGQGHGLVTVSMGVATMRPLPGQGLAALIALADLALYRAKAGGRDRIEVARPASDGATGHPVPA
jgi:diguanylate cyclase (GGDEF)-like protein